MASPFDKQADFYASARPSYPSEWFDMLSSLTPHHAVAWDAGTGTGQAAIALAKHYDRVVATDVSEAQLSRAAPHPRVRYAHTPASMTEDELVAALGGEGSPVDLVTAAQAVHWFDLPKFYGVVDRVLRRPGGVVAVWGYREIRVGPSFDPALSRFISTTMPYWDPNIRHFLEGYRNLPFPFDAVGVGAEGEPATLEMRKDVSFDGFLGLLRSWSGVNTAKERGVDLLRPEVVAELEAAWGGRSLVRTVTYTAFMIAGKPRREST
uniref:Putative methyltransferase DDB_G0268948 n=1 Tax=Anthurium amnicola TaxID=1678845 RepID=A0A1D1YPE3_9ARAE